MSEPAAGRMRRLVLGCNDPGQPYPVTEILRVFSDRKIAAGQADNTESFAAVARNSGTHNMKALAPRAKDYVIRATAAGNAHQRRWLPFGNGHLAKYAKIIFMPIAIDGAGPARSLVDHVLEPDEWSDLVFASFINAFSLESLLAIQDGLSERRKFVSDIRDPGIPVTFIPGPDGADLQVTPVSPMAMFNEFAEELKTADRRIPVCYQMVSTKPLNISVAFGGMRKKFHAKFPERLSPRYAAAWKIVKGGHFPPLDDEQVRQLIVTFAEMYARERLAASGEAFVNARMRIGLDRLGHWIIDLLHDHLEEIRETVLEVDPQCEPRCQDPVALLCNGYWADKDQRDRVRQALRSARFTSLLERRELPCA